MEPGQTRTFVTYYDLSDLAQDLRPPLALCVGGPFRLDVINNEFSPNPFTIVAYVMNTGSGAAEETFASISLDLGLELAPGQNATVSLGRLGPQEEKMITCP